MNNLIKPIKIFYSYYKMLDFLKSMNLSDELKINDVYNLFKTDSSELNLNIISNLQKFHNVSELFNYYTKEDSRNVFEMFNILFSTIKKIYEENEKKEKILKNDFKLEVENYLSDISKIILLFYLIKKNNELIFHLLKCSKKLRNRFSMEKKAKFNIYETINNFINDLKNDSHLAFQRNYSRRGTKENTISSLNKIGLNLSKSFNLENNSKEEDYVLFQCNTPKFEDDEAYEEKSNSNLLNLESNGKIKEENFKILKKKSNETNGSSLSFKNMKVVYDSNLKIKIDTRKKSKTIKMGLAFSDHKPSYKFKKASISNNNIIPYNNDFEMDNKQNSIENYQILTDFLNNINSLYKNGKINSHQKISIKKLIISESDAIIEKFSQLYLFNRNLDKDLKSKYIKEFLLEQINNWK